MSKLKRGKSRSAHSGQVIIPIKEEIMNPTDTLTIYIKSLRLMDEDPGTFVVEVIFYDQIIVSGIINSIAARADDTDTTVLTGEMFYDPSDYDKISLMADQPLRVRMKPWRIMHSTQYSSVMLHSPEVASDINLDISLENTSCCNIDILSVIMEHDKVIVRKRMEPQVQPPVSRCKSWDNLPLLTMELVVKRNEANHVHQKLIRNANFMKMTLVAAYNTIQYLDEEYEYTAASRLPNLDLILFNRGYKPTKNFNSLHFERHWESLRVEHDNFSKGDEIFHCALEDIQNDTIFSIAPYMYGDSQSTTVWGSFHRTLMLENSDNWLWDYIRQYQWPLEVHLKIGNGGNSYMALINVSNLLYAGEDTVRLAVPLQWINAAAMMDACGCELLLTPHDNTRSTPNQNTKDSKSVSDSPVTYNSQDDLAITTGADENDSFVVVEFKLARPLRKVMIPPLISDLELNNMLKEMEQAGPFQRYCYGRGYLDRHWTSTVKCAATALRKVPYYGMTEFTTVSRQLSETRTRVELSTSYWQDAAIYVNNNFVVKDYLKSDVTYEEMLIKAHSCLMIKTCETLIGVDNIRNIDPLLRAARHARQLQDISHSLDLYLQYVAQKPTDADVWRELATCLKDVDRGWANVCLDNALMLNTRHPLTLISKGCMVYEEDPTAAEPFFVALLTLNPFWSTAWIIASAYYKELEQFDMADQIIKYYIKTRKEALSIQYLYPNGWEHELGDWWDDTPILPGMSPYYDACDLLLRLRAVELAEVCVSQALCEANDSATYFHMVALCCRLRGKFDDAICHIRAGLKKYGEINYLRSLEAECYHKKKDMAAAKLAIQKAGGCLGAYSLLISLPIHNEDSVQTVLVDLTRRQPNAYVWIALANTWIARAEKGELIVGSGGGKVDTIISACACATQALKYDRRAGKAWFQLARFTKPSARRLHCLEMARSCGYQSSPFEDLLETRSVSQQSLCHYLGKELGECHCYMCEHIQL